MSPFTITRMVGRDGEHPDSLLPTSQVFIFFVFFCFFVFLFFCFFVFLFFCFFVFLFFCFFVFLFFCFFFIYVFLFFLFIYLFFFLQTCFFTLYLPAYTTKERMKEALQISLQCLDIDRDVNV